MKTSEVGFCIVKHFERLELVAYRDGGGVLTNGYGHTGADVFPGQKITEVKADEWLRKDIIKAEKGVDEAVDRALNLSQFDACVSLAFNIGVRAFLESTLVVKLNKGDMHGASNQFLRWCLDNGKVEPGLAIRRMAERLCFLGRDWKVVI